jgi:hypothetical protein
MQSTPLLCRDKNEHLSDQLYGGLQGSESCDATSMRELSPTLLNLYGGYFPNSPRILALITYVPEKHIYGLVCDCQLCLETSVSIFTAAECVMTTSGLVSGNQQ